MQDDADERPTRRGGAAKKVRRMRGDGVEMTFWTSLTKRELARDIAHAEHRTIRSLMNEALDAAIAKRKPS